ncbi:uncharacterized protein LOC116159324 isoform X2 [Photinus pyralis]|uniref:uncharacterized protein LOC116159324 isoform X2 n=1 Tax=Photinus pyralis TaxID=7054 RepID=UPI0012671718|nr:uncharacterized protein LOC116159324 isoform X2 [Photinus pyralis]
MNTLPKFVQENAQKATETLLPLKSKEKYEKEFETFTAWQSKHKIFTINETVLLSYFQELSEKYTPTSLWTKYSLLKSTFIVKKKTDISNYNQLIYFLKVKSKGYKPKKSQVLTGDQVFEFIKRAPNDIYLLHKVVLVMGVFGGLRRDEMVKMCIDDITDKGSVVIVNVPETKTGTSKGFTIVEEEEINALKLVRQYLALRPKHTKERRFFLTYRKGCCTVQPVGKNTIGSVPNIIAKYLKLDNPHQFTGHCLRRTSATLLVEAGASFETLKMHGKWKSNTVAQSYVEDSLISKNRISCIIASAMITWNCRHPYRIKI